MTYRDAAIGLGIFVALGWLGPPVNADVWITDGSGTSLNRYSDGGTLLESRTDVHGEGIGDLAVAADGAIWTSTNTLGAAWIYRLDLVTGVATRPIPDLGWTPFDAVIGASSATAPIAVSSLGELYVGANVYMSERNVPPEVGPSLPAKSIVKRNPIGSPLDWTLVVPPTTGQVGNYTDLRFAADGTLYAARDDNTLERFDVGTGASMGVLATDVSQFAISAGGVVAILNGQRDVVAIDPVTGVVGATLLSHDALDAAFGPGTRVDDFVFGPDDSLLVAAPGTTGVFANVRILKFDAANPSGVLFATSYFWDNAGPVMLEYTVPEPTTAVAAIAIGSIVARRRRERHHR